MGSQLRNTTITGTLGVTGKTTIDTAPVDAADVARKQEVDGVKGANIASASTIDLGAATGTFVDVTGTTTITAIASAAAGVERTVRFTGVLTLTYNATSLVLPTAQNITTAVGDVAVFRSLGSGNWKCVVYTRADGKAPGLANCDNTSDANKPVSTAQQTALDAKVDKTTTVNGHALSGNVTVTKGDVGLGNCDNTSDANKPVSTAQQTALNAKEASANKDTSGGYAGLTLLKINFWNAARTFLSFFTNSNTAAHTYTFQDRDGTIADDTDLALKAPLASPALTGTPTAPTAAGGTNTTQIATTAFAKGEADGAKAYADSLVVGLYDDRGNYDASGNAFPSSGGSGSAGAILKGDIWTISVAGTLGGTAVKVGDWIRARVDAPGSTAGNWAIVEGGVPYVPENTANKDTDGTLASNSDTKYPSQKAVKTYADAAQSAVISAAASDATTKANAAQSVAIQRGNHTGTQTLSTISDAGTAAAAALDADSTLASFSDTKVPTQKAVNKYAPPSEFHNTSVKFLGGFFKDVSGTRDNRLFLYESVDGITFTARNGGNPVIDLSGSLGDVATCRVARYRGEWVIVFETGNYGNVAYWAYVKTKDWVNFTAPVTVSTSAVVSAGEYTWGPHPFVDDDGSFYITFTKANSAQTVQTQYWMKSTDGALTSWTSPTQLTVAGGSGNFFRDAQIFKVGPRYYLAYYQGSQNIASGPTASGPWVRCTNETSDMEVCSYVRLPNGNWRLYSELSDTGAGLKYVDLSPDFYGLVNYASANAISPTHLHNGFVISLEGNEQIERPMTARDDVYPWPKWSIVRDDFVGYQGSQYGDWGWAGSGTITLAGYQPASGDYYDGILKVSNTANANGSAYAATNGQRPTALSDTSFEFRFHARLTSISNVRYGIGLTFGGDTLPGNGVYVDINPGTNANFRAFAAGSVVADSGVAADTSWHTISVKCFNGYVGISVETNGVWSTEVWSSSATNFYGAGLPQIIVNNTEAVQKAVLMDWFAVARK